LPDASAAAGLNSADSTQTGYQGVTAMQMIYQSDSYVVVQIEMPVASPGDGPLTRGGYEIVDRHARREIFLEGLMAEHFKQGVQALADTQPTEEAVDEFISGFSGLAQQPLAMH
jgi:hypothetical protein